MHGCQEEESGYTKSGQIFYTINCFSWHIESNSLTKIAEKYAEKQRFANFLMNLQTVKNF